MLSKIYNKIKTFIHDVLSDFSNSKDDLKKQYHYEIFDVSFKPKENKHHIEIKLSGKAQSSFFWAEELAANKKYIDRLSPNDLKTVTYLATCDHFSNTKFEPMYRLFRVNSPQNTEKKIGVENIFTGRKEIKSLEAITNSNFLARLHFLDVFQLGYFVGQEQVRKNKDLVDKAISDSQNFTLLPLNNDSTLAGKKNRLLVIMTNNKFVTQKIRLMIMIIIKINFLIKPLNIQHIDQHTP